MNIADSWSLRSVEHIEAFGLLPSGHLVQAVIMISGFDGELDEETSKGVLQGGNGPSRTGWRCFGKTEGQHFFPPSPFSPVLW